MGSEQANNNICTKKPRGNHFSLDYGTEYLLARRELFISRGIEESDVTMTSNSFFVQIPSSQGFSEQSLQHSYVVGILFV